ncbi:hypothetical protein BJ741DRAFT_589232 [Chytriomyces cf. hyalinus JEL632]|nr:hypothetical protein BJ741DRAFT_589232 [Chytriomyces cf. hyalinus JEL632]
MNKLGINDLLSYTCDTIPKTKRFSSLSQLELSSLWKDTTAYVQQQVSHKRAINFPGVGSFYVRKYKLATGELTEKWVPTFVPSKTWEKVPGYKVVQNKIIGTGSNAAEPLNFAAIATISGFSRDDVEPGIKDMVHALFLLLKRGSNVSLLFPEMGRLVFYNCDIKFTFNVEFLNLIAAGPLRIPDHIPSVSPTVKPRKSEKSAQDAKKKVDLQVTANASQLAEKLPIHIPEEIAHSKHAHADTHHHEEPALKEFVHEVVAAKESASKPKVTENAPSKPVDPKQAEIEEIERLANLLITRGEHHTHPHADVRLWSDAKCPICRHKNATVVEVKDALDEKEKMQDKMLLLLSLEVDREFLKETKETDGKRLKAAVNTAQYNYAEAQHKEAIRQRDRKNLPLGNIFENRDPGPDRVLQAKELRAGLYDQMTIRKCNRQREQALKDFEDRELNERLLKEFKTAEVQNHFDKLRRRHQQQEALTEQMVTQENARRQEAILEPMTENCFARSESLMFLYQKEKAKQLYQEQLAILKQRREYETKVAELEKQHSLDRLSVSRKELQKDIQSIKKTNFMTRKGLENTWGVQKVQREQAQAALGY